MVLDVLFCDLPSCAAVLSASDCHVLPEGGQTLGCQVTETEQRSQQCAAQSSEVCVCVGVPVFYTAFITVLLTPLFFLPSPRVMREMLVYWRKHEKVEKEQRRKAEREAMEQHKLNEEMREVRAVCVCTCRCYPL